MSPDRPAHQPLCVGIGEVLWDCLPSGRNLGGAPANVAAHARQLGAQGAVVSAVGDDADGREIFERLQAFGVQTDGIRVVPELPTGRVDVTLNAAGVPTFMIQAPAAWDAISCDQTQKSLAGQADAVVFGSLAQRDPRSRRAICEFLAATRPDCLRVFDVNFRPPFVSADIVRDGLARADVLKLNETEMPTLLAFAGVDADAPDPLRTLLERFDLKAVVCTLGPNGSRMVTRDWEGQHPAVPAVRVDTVGCGDAFTATVTVGLLRGFTPDRIQTLANRVGAFVCSQAGAVPRLPHELIDAF